LAVNPSRRAASASALRPSRSREAIGIGVVSVRTAVRFRAEIGCQILRAPGQTSETLARAGVAAKPEQASGRFRRDGDDPDATVRPAAFRLTHGDARREVGDILAIARLRQHDALRASRDDRIEIGIGHLRVEGIDPDKQSRPPCKPRELAQEGSRDGARFRLPSRCDGILQIDQQHIRAGLKPLGELARVIARHEQQRAHHAAGRLRMKACRRHSATSLPSWLKVR
jgi:hypothetical protein